VLLLAATGVFDWLQQQGRLAALIRQISNPMAGVDTTLLALAGTGFTRPQGLWVYELRACGGGG